MSTLAAAVKIKVRRRRKRPDRWKVYCLLWVVLSTITAVCLGIIGALKGNGVILACAGVWTGLAVVWRKHSPWPVTEVLPIGWILLGMAACVSAGTTIAVAALLF